MTASRSTVEPLELTGTWRQPRAGHAGAPARRTRIRIPPATQRSGTSGIRTSPAARRAGPRPRSRQTDTGYRAPRGENLRESNDLCRPGAGCRPPHRPYAIAAISDQGGTLVAARKTPARGGWPGSAHVA
ncbi:MAG: hypothetical protein ACLSVD_03755 [Eggerthellaceae bacterium]